MIRTPNGPYHKTHKLKYADIVNVPAAIGVAAPVFVASLSVDGSQVTGAALMGAVAGSAVGFLVRASEVVNGSSIRDRIRARISPPEDQRDEVFRNLDRNIKADPDFVENLLNFLDASLESPRDLGL